MTKLLLARGDTVTGLARSRPSFEKVQATGATAIEGVWTEVDLLRDQAARADAVIHCAFRHEGLATDYVKVCEEDRTAIKVMAEGLESTNVGGTKQKTLIYISGTFSTSGPDEDDPKVISDALPRARSEKVTFDAQSLNLRTIVVRPAPIVHDGEHLHNFLIEMVRAAKKHGYSAYLDAGNLWPSVHYDDVAELCVLALDKAPSGKALHAVAEEGVSTKDIAEWIGDELEVPVRMVAKEQAVPHFWIRRVLARVEQLHDKQEDEGLDGLGVKGSDSF